MSLKLYSILFNANNPDGEFVTGDLVEIYYDVSLDTSPGINDQAGLLVYLNGIQITSGNNIDWHVQSYKTVTPSYFGYYCNGGFGIYFFLIRSTFPYVLNQYYADYPACNTNPIVCDLAFSPNISVIQPSSLTSNDGSITIEATSTYPIKYKLTNDFDYNDGTGVSSGTFISLYPSTYRIYARDSKNCSANILINLTFNDTYSVIYTISYLNLAGHSSKIEILKRAYAGAASDVICGDIPITLEMRNEGNLDKFQPIVSTQATIRLMAQTNKQYQDLFTNDPRQYQVKFYKDTTGGTSFELQWMGYILPHIHQEQYTELPYPVTIQATDSLTNLSDYAFLQDDGNRFLGSIRILTLISSLLKKTNLALPIRSACNLFADTMDQTSADDPLDQAYVDVDTYYIATAAPSFEFVLKALLKPFRARLIQAEGRWNIIRVEEFISSYAYRDFDTDGVYLTNGTDNPIVDIKAATASNRLRWANQDQNLELRPAFGKLRIQYHLGFKENILRNGDFRLRSTWFTLFNQYIYFIDLFGFQIISPSYPLNTSYELINPINLDDVALVLSAEFSLITKPLGYLKSDTYLMAMGISNSLKIKINIKCPSYIINGQWVDGSGNIVTVPNGVLPYYQKVRLTVFYGNKYLLADGEWTNIPSDLIFYVTQFDQYIDLEKTASWPDVTYGTPKEFNVKIYHSIRDDVDFTSLADLKRKVTNSSIVGFWNNRGAYDPSSGLFPSTGGSGGAGSVVYKDQWTSSGTGIIYGVTVAAGTKISCLKTTPGQDTANWLIGGIILAENTKTEATYGFSTIYYYELQNNTDAPDDQNIVRPNDYDGSFNPYQWILVHTDLMNSIYGNPHSPINFYINKIQVQYLDSGHNPFDTIIRDRNGETNNTLNVQDEIYHGSLSSLITSTVINAQYIKQFAASAYGIPAFDGGTLQLFPSIISFPITKNVLSGKLIYTGYLRDSTGEGYENWARPGIAESDVLHSIFLKTTIAQYNRSWKKITGSLYGDVFFSFIKVLRETIEDNTIYLPASLSYDDKNNMINGEFLELNDIYTDAGSDGTAVSPSSSGFSTGFGG